MINLSDFQPLSIAKIKKFSSTTRFLLKIFSDKVHAIPIEEVTVQTTLRDGTSFRRLSSIIIGLKYLHQPSNFMLNILTLTCNVYAQKLICKSTVFTNIIETQHKTRYTSAEKSARARGYCHPRWTGESVLYF